MAEEKNSGYIYLVRHGESAANALKLFGLDFPLSDLGKRQAVEAGAFFRDKSVGCVVCSNLRRAYDTAFLMFPERDVFHIDKRFREMYFGDLEGKEVTEELLEDIREDPDRIFYRYHGDDIYKRVAYAKEALCSYCEETEGDLVVVGHDTLFELVLADSGYYDKTDGSSSPFVLWSEACLMPNCSVVQLDRSLFSEF